MNGRSFQHSVREHLGMRMLSDGSFTDRPRGTFRIDSTAWGIVALRGTGEHSQALESACGRLKAEQGDDGRVWVHRDHAESYWPTAVAILAWQKSPASDAAQARAIRFLLQTTGVHYSWKQGDPAAHDPQLRGWPWIGGTHSWVEPTALAIMALKATGNGPHPRVREAIRMMLDRQLPHGGWNYGNTLVFGRELHPMPESTGAALSGLAGEVERGTVARSLDYLEGEIDRLRTPVSLGWSLLGLAAWNRWPSNGGTLVRRCLAEQSRYGDYDTSAISLLLLGGLAGEGSASPLFSR